MIGTDRKKEKKKILTLIKESIMISPKSMYELAKELHSNWDTIKTNVAILKDLGIVDVQDQKVVYVQKGVSTNNKNFAGLPVTEDMKKKVYALAQQFVREWKKRSNKKISNTIIQKAVVEIADEFPKLNIPRGWYLYGKVVLVKLNEEILNEKEYTYNFSAEIPDVKKLNEKISNLANQLCNMTINEVVSEQYTHHNSKMYLVKNQIENILYGLNIGKNKDKLSKNLYELVFLFELGDEDAFSDEIYGIIKDGITFMIDILNSNISNSNLQHILIDLFKSIWKILATHNLYFTMEGNLGYDQVVINALLIEKATFYKNELIDQCASIAT